MLSFLLARSSFSSNYLSPLYIIGVSPPSTGLTSATGEFNVPDLNGVELLSLIVVITGIKNVFAVAPDFN